MLTGNITIGPLAGLWLCLISAICSGALAEDAPAEGALAEESTVAGFAGSEALHPEALAGQRGREGLDFDTLIMQLNDVHADASIADNALNSQMTGGNLVETGAFGNAAGLVFSVQNSGNHVIIQNTTLINVNMQP